MSPADPAGVKPAQINPNSLRPFVGPRPFEAADRHLFFGREREAHEVASLVLANRLFILYAMSGAGKTSLINAGVLPLVRDEIEVLPTARFLGRAPGGADGTVNVFTQAALSCWIDPEELSSLRRTTLGEFLAARERVIEPIGIPKPRLLVFDQFEELFTAHPERWQERAGFLEQLTEAVDSDPGLRVLVVVREDFLSRMLAFADTFYTALKDRYFLEPLRKPAASLAITGPVRTTGRSFEPTAVDDLVRKLSTSRVDLGSSRIVQIEGEFVEPVLLQVVCQKLWAELPAEVSTITAADIRDVETPLADFYSYAIRRAADLGQTPERQIREWVEQNLLTHPGGTRGTVHVGPNATAGLPNETVERLVGTLLRAEFRAGARWLEITHDSLLGPIEQSNAAFFRAEGPLSRQADALALTVAQRLQSIVTARRLNDPVPLDVSWTAAEPALMDQWEEVARPESGARWVPPSGIWVTERDELAGSGNLADLIDRLPACRLVVLGEPGSGKTTLLVRLVLDLLGCRATGGPVPVLVSAASWDPVAQDLPGWLADQLTVSFPHLAAGQQPDGQATAVGLALLAAGLILPVIDDLDEMMPGTRRLAVSRINDALRPGDFLVAACRTEQYQQTARPSDGDEVVVRSAAVIQLDRLSADEVGRYLRACADNAEAAAKWDPILDSLGTSTPAGHALETPLMVGLARARYSRGPAGEPPQSPTPAELCEPRLGDRTAVEEVLFDSFLASARSATMAGRWPARKTEEWLSFIARYLERMTGDRRLAWWQLGRATPRYLLGLATGIVIGLLAAAITAQTLDSSRLVAVLDAAGVMFGLALGLGLAGGPPSVTGVAATDLTSASPRAVLGQARRTALLAAAAYGVAAGLAAGLAAGFRFGILRGLAVGLLAAIVAGLVSASYYSAWLRWQIGRVWLALTGRLPWRSMAFLADAHALGALRREGPYFQFRYGTLQRRLAAPLAGTRDGDLGQPGRVGGNWPRTHLGVSVGAALALLIVAAGSVAVSAHVASGRAIPGRPAAASHLSTPSAAFLPQDGASAQVVAFSPDSRYLAVGDADGAVSLWNLTTGRLAVMLTGSPREAITSIAFGPDGKVLAAGDRNGDVYLWNLVTGHLVTAFACVAKAIIRSVGGGSITDVTFSPAGQILAVTAVSPYAFACFTRTSAHAPFFTLPSNGKAPAIITAMNFSKDAAELVIGAASGETFVLARSRYRLRHLASAPSTGGAISSIAFSPDDRTLALAASSGVVRLFEPDSLQQIGLPLADPGRSGGINSVAFSMNGRLLAAADGNGSTYVRDVRTGKIINVLSDPASAGVSGVAFNVGGNVATADLSGETYLWPASLSSRSLPHNTTNGAPTALAEANAVNNLLVTSASTRSQWNAGSLIIDVASCVAIVSAVTQIGDIARERTTEVAEAKHLRTGALPDGPALKSQLLTALKISLSIDNDYLAWAEQQHSSGCTVGTNSSYYQQATLADTRATFDKNTFVNTWNPIATRFGLEQFSASDI